MIASFIIHNVGWQARATFLGQLADMGVSRPGGLLPGSP
jgi:hypothetical protein